MKRPALLATLASLLMVASLLVVLSSCNLFRSQSHPQSPTFALGNCPDQPPTIMVTTAILTTATTGTVYLGSGGNLYALNAQTGAMRWCRQVKRSGDFPCPGHCPAPPSILWGQPAVADGVVYACASGFGDGQTYAFRASDGALLWRTASDCWAVSMPFGDYAAPLVDHGVVYSGSRALRAQDGQAIWTTRAGPADPRYIAFQAMNDGVLYANDDTSVYAISAKDGSVRWKFTAPDGSTPGDRLTVAGGRVYYGTLDSVDGSEKSHLYALDAAHGTLLWTSRMAAYSNPTLANGLIYIGSASHTLYALQASDGAVRWRYTAASSGAMATTIAGGVAYTVLDGPYALDAPTGKVLWHQSFGVSEGTSYSHQSFGASPSDLYTPITVAGNIVYLARTDGMGNSVIYALNAATGAIYWRTSAIRQVTPLVVG